MDLNERKQKILSLVIERYIRTGEPVGSKALCEMLDNTVSSATIRNEMSELAESGYLEQPHTSAGRVPSQQGYRYYVDNLMGRRELAEEERVRIRSLVATEYSDPDKLIEAACAALAQLTGCAAVSTTPAGEAAAIKKVEAVVIGRRTAMIMLLTTNGILKSRACRPDAELNEDAAEAFYNLVNKHFIGLPVSEVSLGMIQTLAASLGEKAFSVAPLLVTLAELARESAETGVRLRGQNNLLSHREYYGNAAELLRFLSGKEPLTRLMAEHSGAPLNISIGSENVYPEMVNSSMILSKYAIDGAEDGSIGIIGPTRIDYARLIPNIEYLTRVVSGLLSDLLDGE